MDGGIACEDGTDALRDPRVSDTHYTRIGKVGVCYPVSYVSGIAWQFEIFFVASLAVGTNSLATVDVTSAQEESSGLKGRSVRLLIKTVV